MYYELLIDPESFYCVCFSVKLFLKFVRITFIGF